MAYATFRERVAADAAANERADFIRLTYLHLGGAVLAFAGLTAGLVNSSLGARLTATVTAGPMSWLILLGAFMAAGWVAERWARSATSVGMQYAGLGLYVVAEAIIFTPLLYIAANFFPNQPVIATAGVLTGVVFGGLTVVAFTTRKDFSFLRSALMVGGFAAMGLVVVSLLFGFTLGSIFSTAMVVLAAGYILYHTSNVMHHYPIGSHVAASLALFSAVALMFYYILRLVMAFASDD